MKMLVMVLFLGNKRSQDHGNGGSGNNICVTKS